MKNLQAVSKALLFSFLYIFILNYSLKAKTPDKINRDSILAAASEIIHETKYCALVTVDSTGQPQVRTMNPYPMEKDWVVWFATARSSRKLKEIEREPRVSVYYANHNEAKGYVVITGKASIIDNQEVLVEKHREYWDRIAPDWKEKFVLIRIEPVVMDVINYKKGIRGDPVTSRSPSVEF